MIDLIEQGIIARLKAASDAGALGYKYRTLDSYPVDWDEYLKDKKGGMPAPAAWAVFAGWKPGDTEDNGRLHVAATFGVVVMAENARGETFTRHGGPDPTKEPGSYRLAVDAAALLLGQDFGLPIDTVSIGALRFVARLAVFKERKVSLMAVELMTGFELYGSNFGTDDEPFADFERFHANWDIPPFGNVDADAEEAGVQIPADDTADATDHVELET